MIVAIRGSGIAATGCAHLLKRAGLRVAIETARRPPVPSILLSDPALSLLRGVFDRPALFADRPRICRRVVAWGSAVPVIVPHSAALVSEADVQAALGAPQVDTVTGAGAQADFTIVAAPPIPNGALHIFGDRNAVAAKILFRDAGCADEGRVEAVDSGWLFLVPASDSGGDGRTEGWLLGVGGSIDALLAQSRLIAPVVDALGAESMPFMTAPRLHMPLCGEDWLACGTAAIGFDPICGDGTAQSVREAILAAAVIDAIARGGDRAALMTHYQSMLVAAMRRHLFLCAQFYQNGGTGDWWRGQHSALIAGHDWCTALLAKMPEPRFMLRDFRLTPRLEAA